MLKPTSISFLFFAPLIWAANLIAQTPPHFLPPDNIKRLPSPEQSSGAGLALISATACDVGVVCHQELYRFERFLSNFDIYGQIRVRQETDFERINRPTRNRQRLRLRLGATYQLNSAVKIGGRMTTGDRKSALEPLERSGAPLSYQNLGDAFDKFEFNLDRIYFELTPDCLPDTTVWLGKFRIPLKFNPIFEGPVGDLVWDEAAQAEGFAARRVLTDFCGADDLYLAGGISPVWELSNGNEAALYYSQIWADKRIAEPFQISVGATYFHWTNLNPNGNTDLSSQNNNGNATVPVGPNPEDVIFASQFRILNPMLVFRIDSTNHHPLLFAWETFVNFGSFSNDRDTGYSVGLSYGPASNSSKQGNWELYYTWNSVEQESVFTPVGQDDFLRSTNFRGHMTGYRCFLWDNVPMRISFLSSKPIIPIGGSRETEWRGRIDLTANF